MRAALREIVEEFAEADREERLQLLLEYGQRLPPLPERLAAAGEDALERVVECQSPLFLAVEVGADRAVALHFDAPLEAPTTRGFAGILHAGLDGASAEEVLTTPGEITAELRLAEVVSPLRMRGMAAMLARIKRQVAAAVEVAQKVPGTS